MCRERNQELTQETIRVWDLVYDVIVIVSWSVIEEEWMSSQGALRLCFLQDGGVKFSFARRVFTVFLCDIFTGLES